MPALLTTPGTGQHTPNNEQRDALECDIIRENQKRRYQSPQMIIDPITGMISGGAEMLKMRSPKERAEDDLIAQQKADQISKCNKIANEKFFRKQDKASYIKEGICFEQDFDSNFTPKLDCVNSLMARKEKKQQLKAREKEFRKERKDFYIKDGVCSEQDFDSEYYSQVNCYMAYQNKHDVDVQAW